MSRLRYALPRLAVRCCGVLAAASGQRPLADDDERLQGCFPGLRSGGASTKMPFETPILLPLMPIEPV